MSHSERLRELAELLAAGIQRFLANERKAIPSAESAAENMGNQLDVIADAEAPCGPPPRCPA